MISLSKWKLTANLSKECSFEEGEIEKFCSNKFDALLDINEEVI